MIFNYDFLENYNYLHKKNKTKVRTMTSFTLTDAHLKVLDTKSSLGGDGTEISDTEYTRYMNNFLKNKKFKEYVISTTGQRTRVRFKNGFMYDCGKLILPTSFITFIGRKAEPVSELGLCTTRFQKLKEEEIISEDEQSYLVGQTFESLIDENHTGNHYRNHTVNVKTPHYRTCV